MGANYQVPQKAAADQLRGGWDLWRWQEQVSAGEDETTTVQQSQAQGNHEVPNWQQQDREVSTCCSKEAEAELVSEKMGQWDRLDGGRECPLSTVPVEMAARQRESPGRQQTSR